MHNVPDFVQIGPFSYKINFDASGREAFFPAIVDHKNQVISIDKNATPQRAAFAVLMSINYVILESLPELKDSDDFSTQFTLMQVSTLGASPDVFAWVMAGILEGRDDCPSWAEDEPDDDGSVSEEAFEAAVRADNAISENDRKREREVAMNAAEKYKGPYDDALLKYPPIYNFDKHKGRFIDWGEHGQVWVCDQAASLFTDMGIGPYEVYQKGYGRVVNESDGSKSLSLTDVLPWMQDNAFQTQRLQKALELMGITEEEAIDQGLAKNRSGTIVLTGSGKALFFEAERQEREMTDALKDLKVKGISAEDVAELAEVLQERDRLQLKYSDIAARRKKVEGSLRTLESREENLAHELEEAEEKARYMQNDFKTLIGSDEIAGAM